MKHFLLTLLCVGMCLATMAANPLIKGKTLPVLNKLDKWEKIEVEPKHPLPHHLHHLPSLLRVDQKLLTPQHFFTEHGVTPDDNLLLKNAPRRSGSENVSGNKIAFMDCYEYNPDNNDIELSKNYYGGGWDVHMESIDDGVYNAYLYYGNLPVTVYVDSRNDDAEMEMGCMGAWQWCDTTSTGLGTRKTYFINDTTRYMFIIDEGWLMGDSEEFTNISGNIYSDGTLFFPDGYVFYTIDHVTTTKLNYKQEFVSTSNDTIESFSPFYRNTYLMTPNAVHSYDVKYDVDDVEHYDDNVYMYQYDDSTAVVWNLWQMGGQGNFMLIHEDGSMTFPIGQVVGTDEVDYLEEAFPDYDWSEGYDIVVVNYDEANDDYSTDDITGTVTHENISWDGSVLWRYCMFDDVYYVIQYPPLVNNELTFTNGDIFLLGYAEKPAILSETYEESVLVTAATESENCTVYLFDGEGNMIDNPAIIARTSENQEFTFYAISMEYGKNQSEVSVKTIGVPALGPSFMIGDVDGDGKLGLNDIITLIDHLLTNDWDDAPGFISEAADVNMDGSFNVQDMAELGNLVTNDK